MSMLSISQINYNNYQNYSPKVPETKDTVSSSVSLPNEIKQASAENYKAYIPSFAGIFKKSEVPSYKKQLKSIGSTLGKEYLPLLNQLEKQGILQDKSSNDGSTVLENLYKIATEPRIQGLNNTQILQETIRSLANPFSITQKFGDIPQEVASEISKETGEEFPSNAYNVISSSCVVASMEYKLALTKPAEFVRFVEGLSGENYSVDKTVKMSDISTGTADCLWKLRKFNTNSKIDSNWEDVTLKIQPDRSAIVRARVQSSYKDPGERSCIDVLFQSALLNLGSRATYNALTDKRETWEFNSEDTGLSDMEKNFVEQILFEKPILSVVYQNIDQNGHLAGYNAELNEVKQHIIKSLELEEPVILGYTMLDENQNVMGGHEITVIGYNQDEDGKGYFVCNDTDDEIDAPIKIYEEKLLPMIHHAGIIKDALSKDDVVVNESWREILKMYKNSVTQQAA